MKKCFKCNLSKELFNFYKHPGMKDGYLNKCKECNKKDVKENYSLKREQYSKYENLRNKSENRRKSKALYLIKYRLNNQDKNKARALVGRAIKAKKLVKLPCENCGNIKVQAHHDDYSKPLEVKWLCFKCHRELEHNQIVTKNT